MTENLTSASLSDPRSLAALLRPQPPHGVLSIYVDADSRDDPGLQRTGIDIRNRLSELERNIADEGPRERTAALRDLLDRLGPEIDRITSPREPGRGRALFAPLGDGEITRITGQMPMPNRVVLDDSAFIHPLLEVLDEGRAAGVVLASTDAARLLEWRLGELRELERMEPEVVEAPHERSGPVGSSPAAGPGSPMYEQRAARENARTQRFVEEIATAAAALAAEHGWERMLISGGDRLTEPLANALGSRPQLEIIRDPRMLIQFEPGVLSETVSERLRADHAEREQKLLESVREAALGSGAGAVGLSEVAGALNEGRVSHLVYDPEVRYQGSIGSDGMLYAPGEGPEGVELTPEPRLTERLVERALETGARVSPVEGAARGVLADADGIGALLRW